MPDNLDDEDEWKYPPGSSPGIDPVAADLWDGVSDIPIGQAEWAMIDKVAKELNFTPEQVERLWGKRPEAPKDT